MPTKRFSTRSSRPMPLSRAELVELRQQRRRRQRLAVERDGVAALEADADLGRLVGRFHRRDGALIDDRRRFLRRVLQHFAFGRRVQQVGVDRERRLALLVLGDRDLVLVARTRSGRSRPLKLPLAPRRDDLDRRDRARNRRQLEAHLVVALAGRAVRDRVGADLVRRSRSASWRSAAARSRCRAGTGPRTARWRGTSGRRSRARTPRAGPR